LTLGNAYRAVSDLESLMYRSIPDNIDEGPHAEALDSQQEVLTFYVHKLFRDVKLLAERVNAPMTAADIQKLTPSAKDAHDVKLSPDGDWYSPQISTISSYFDSLEALTDGKDVTGLGVFEAILGNTGKVIDAFDLDPKKEKDVQDAMGVALNFAFHDVVRELKLSKPIKSYQADFGVKSLHAVAEYKFADSKKEMKTALDGTYSDMRAYDGTMEWRYFYAIYYMTGPYFTQAEVDAVYKIVRADFNWRPLVVVGRGARPPKKTS